ncbi:hypothetical protein YC2023_088086 [Brassica napus]
MIPIVAAGNFLDGFQCVLSGSSINKKKFVRVTTICVLKVENKPSRVARGCGWQKIGACVNLGSYYLVGVPLGLLLGFHLHLGGRVRLNKKTQETLNVTASG